ncbi:MAG: hypothetical protein IJI57_03535 [Flexilinea sp.]|nr:hypothetical protein [Flexilinea sp.]
MENEIYEKLLNDKLSANLGYLYENIVAQILTANGDELFYHTFLNSDCPVSNPDLIKINHEFQQFPCFFFEVDIEYCLFERLAQLVRALR